MIYANSFSCFKTHTYRKKSTNVLPVLVCVISLTFSFVCLFTKNETYRYLFLLPLLHGLITIFFVNNYSNLGNHIIRAIILLLYFLRNVVCPFIMLASNFETMRVYFDGIAVLKSSLLLSYEYLFINFAMVLFLKKQNDCENKTIFVSHNESRLYKKPQTSFLLVVALITAFMILCLIIVPDIRTDFKSFWTTDSGELIVSFSSSKLDSYQAGSIKRLLYTFFTFFFTPMLIIWIAMGISFIRRKKGDTSIGALLSCALPVISTFFCKETSLLTIFTLLVLYFYIFKIYPKNKYKIIVLAGTMFMFVFVLMIVMRARESAYSGTSFLGSVSKLLNAYIPGIYNVSSLWAVEVPSKLSCLYMDIYSGIPLRSIIPPLINDSRLSDYFNESIGSGSQILPFIGQTFFYFGLFGPFVQTLFIKLSLYFETKMNQTDNKYMFVAMLTSGVIIGSGILIYDLTILVTYSTRIVLPIVLVAAFNKSYRRNILSC